MRRPRNASALLVPDQNPFLHTRADDGLRLTNVRVPENPPPVFERRPLRRRESRVKLVEPRFERLPRDVGREDLLFEVPPDRFVHLLDRNDNAVRADRGTLPTMRRADVDLAAVRAIRPLRLVVPAAGRAAELHGKAVPLKERP